MTGCPGWALALARTVSSGLSSRMPERSGSGLVMRTQGGSTSLTVLAGSLSRSSATATLPVSSRSLMTSGR